MFHEVVMWAAGVQLERGEVVIWAARVQLDPDCDPDLTLAKVRSGSQSASLYRPNTTGKRHCCGAAALAWYSCAVLGRRRCCTAALAWYSVVQY